jgi:propanediol dehydratase large subunit
MSDGRVVELDSKGEAEFDIVDTFIALHGIDLNVATEAMALDNLAVARMFVDPGVPRSEVVRLVAGMTPAKLACVLGTLRPAELVIAMTKMRARRTPIAATIPCFWPRMQQRLRPSGSVRSKLRCRCSATLHRMPSL